METMPSAAELIEAAVECLRGELLPALSGREAFQARVCANVLEIARRELLHGPAADAAEARRLAALLAGIAPGAPPRATADPADARRALCDAIREGRIDPASPALADHLWADVLARVSIEQPTYPSLAREHGDGAPDPHH